MEGRVIKQNKKYQSLGCQTKRIFLLGKEKKAVVLNLFEAKQERNCFHQSQTMKWDTGRSRNGIAGNFYPVLDRYGNISRV
jgi:hypothetical protein